MRLSMKAHRRACKPLVLAEYSKSTAFSRLSGAARERSAPCHDALHLLPPELGHHACPAPDLDRVLARCGPVDDATHDALRNAGRAEHVVGEIEVPMVRVDRLAPDTAAVCGDVVALCRNAEPGEI